MKKSFDKLICGYKKFREKYASGDNSVMQRLADRGQRPEVMVVACSDSRVDPSVILQCDPGELFMVRNVANIVPPYELDDRHHGTSAALEFGVCYLKVKHLIILGHSQCGGIQALLTQEELKQNDFITHWVSVIDHKSKTHDHDEFAKESLFQSYKNCLTFPWIKNAMDDNQLKIHLWFFDIGAGEINEFDFESKRFQKLQ